MNRTRCVDCGFLALRSREGWGFVDADDRYRTTGNSDFAKTVSQIPHCFIRMADLPAEADGLGTTLLTQRIIEIVQRERPDCDSPTGFTSWRQGFTPKEHREMVDRQLMLDREDELRREVWKREDCRDAEMRKREDRRDEEARSRHRNELVVFGVVVSIATVLGAVLGGVLDGVISRGLEPGWWPW